MTTDTIPVRVWVTNLRTGAVTEHEVRTEGPVAAIRDGILKRMEASRILLVVEEVREIEMCKVTEAALWKR